MRSSSLARVRFLRDTAEFTPAGPILLGKGEAAAMAQERGTGCQGGALLLRVAFLPEANVDTPKTCARIMPAIPSGNSTFSRGGSNSPPMRGRAQRTRLWLRRGVTNNFNHSRQATLASPPKSPTAFLSCSTWLMPYTILQYHTRPSGTLVATMV